jgi:hypothetical protein
VKTETGGLCYRCEHRARFLESDGVFRPRCECGDIDKSSNYCYMYQPVQPVIIGKRHREDNRPLFGPPFMSARASRIRIPELMAKVKKYLDGYMPYWVPMTREEKRKRAKEEREVRERLDRWRKEMQT